MNSLNFNIVKLIKNLLHVKVFLLLKVYKDILKYYILKIVALYFTFWCITNRVKFHFADVELESNFIFFIFIASSKYHF